MTHIKPTLRRLGLLLCAASCLPSHALDASTHIQVTPLLKTSQSWNGAPLAYPNGQAEITGMTITLAPGAETGWHSHPVPSFGMVLEGTLQVTLASGEQNTLSAGQALAEVVGTAHNGRNIGSTPVKLLVFYAGAVGTATTEKAQHD